MARYAMAVDLQRCVGCQACMVACKAENGVGDRSFRLRVGEMTWSEHGAIRMEFIHAQCYHCDNPLCVPVCPTGATYVDKATGTVQIDPDRCTGCKACVVACPYDARHVDPAGGFADKCSFCLHRVSDGLQPACVDVCPAGARFFGDLDDPDSPLTSLVSDPAMAASVDRPGTGAKPKLFFLKRQYEGRRS